MGSATADTGQDPRGAPDRMPLWTILDTTPEGRGTRLVSKNSTIPNRATRCIDGSLADIADWVVFVKLCKKSGHG